MKSMLISSLHKQRTPFRWIAKALKVLLEFPWLSASGKPKNRGSRAEPCVAWICPAVKSRRGRNLLYAHKSSGKRGKNACILASAAGTLARGSRMDEAGSMPVSSIFTLSLCFVQLFPANHFFDSLVGTTVHLPFRFCLLRNLYSPSAKKPLRFLSERGIINLYGMPLSGMSGNEEASTPALRGKSIMERM